MMLGLSRRTVRHAWAPYVGAFVAMGCGVALIAVTVMLVAAVDVSTRLPGVTAAEREQLDGLSSMFGVMSGVSLFMAMFVVASTFGFVVAARQRELGLLRLVGATPRQVRVMVLGESAVVAAAAIVAGCLLATAVTPMFIALLRSRGVLGVELTMPSPWIAWSVAAGCGAAVALLGSWRASKRASRVSPVAVLREAGLERRRPSVLAMVVGAICLAGPVAVIAVADDIAPLFALIVGILLPEVVVIGVMCFGRVLFPWLAGLLARPFAHRDVAARLARDHVRAGARVPAALAAPILAVSAIAGSMIITLSFTADWTTALDRAQLQAPVVVETNGDRDVAELLQDAPVTYADPRITTGDHELVDVALAERSRGLTAVRGSLDDLGDTGVAVTETYALDAGVDVGDKVRVHGTRREVVAVVGDAPDLYADVLLPRAADKRRVPDVVFVDPGAADLDALLAGTEATVLSAGAWIDQVDDRTRANNELGLWVLLGPAGLYAAIAIVNAVLIGVSQRRTQLRTVALLGATDDQLRRTALWEAGLVGAAALLVGGTITGFVGWLISFAITRDVADVDLTVPVLPLGAIVVVCTGLALVAALVGSTQFRRNA